MAVQNLLVPYIFPFGVQLLLLIYGGKIWLPVQNIFSISVIVTIYKLLLYVSWWLYISFMYLWPFYSVLTHMFSINIVNEVVCNHELVEWIAGKFSKCKKSASQVPIWDCNLVVGIDFFYLLYLNLYNLPFQLLQIWLMHMFWLLIEVWSSILYAVTLTPVCMFISWPSPLRNQDTGEDM